MQAHLILAPVELDFALLSAVKEVAAVGLTARATGTLIPKLNATFSFNE